MVNAIRRIILSEVETVSFDTDDYENSDLKVIKNTSSLHNEFLLHRIGLIPINIMDVNGFNPDDYKFILKKENNGNSEIDVTTKDFVVQNLKTGKNENTTKFFPANPLTGDNILITVLKNNPTGDGESINIEGKCSIGTGNQNSRFSPVSNVLFINKRDNERVQKAFEEKYNSMTDKPGTEELKILAKRFDLEEGDRYFYTDEDGNPNTFDFVIESIGVIPPMDILKRALKKLIDKLTKFIQNLDLTLNSKESPISIREADSVMKGIDITIENESHTLGFLLQTYINKLNEGLFVGYMNPHPLEKKIKIRINFNDEDINVMKDIMDKTVIYLLDTLNKLLLELK
jgi:DNA-directed RNA polymerase subunit L